MLADLRERRNDPGSDALCEDEVDHGLKELLLAAQICKLQALHVVIDSSFRTDSAESSFECARFHESSPLQTTRSNYARSLVAVLGHF